MSHSKVPRVYTTEAKKPKATRERLIAPAVFKLPRFKEAHDQLLQAAQVEGLNEVCRWQIHKGIIQDAARIARDEQRANFPESEFAVSVTLAAIARCVWTNDAVVARHLIHRTALGKEFLGVKISPLDGSIAIMLPRLLFINISPKDWSSRSMDEIRSLPDLGEMSLLFDW